MNDKLSENSSSFFENIQQLQKAQAQVARTQDKHLARETEILQRSTAERGDRMQQASSQFK